MNKIIKIEPIQKYFNITWMLGSFCNYDCMYCPAEYHDATSRLHDLDTMKTAWRQIYQKTKNQILPYKISFTGGEVTANKNFLPLVEWLRSEYTDIDMIVITTNGSASMNYYLRLAKVVEAISFSTHSEFMDEDRFFDTVIAVDRVMPRPKKSLHVNIMNEYWNQEGIERYKKALDQNNISYSINEIDYRHQTRTYPIERVS
jgi:MoaA/NifB/PqqE/SkfB family radical SAM enzyme